MPRWIASVELDNIVADSAPQAARIVAKRLGLPATYPITIDVFDETGELERVELHNDQEAA